MKHGYQSRPGFALRARPQQVEASALEQAKKAPDKPGHISRFKERLEKNH